MPIAYILIGYKAQEPTEVPRKYPLDSLIGHNTFNNEGIYERKERLNNIYHQYPDKRCTIAHARVFEKKILK